MDYCELKKILDEERELYRVPDKRRRLHLRYFIWMYLQSFRLCQYYRSCRDSKDIFFLLRLLARYKARWYEWKMNLLSCITGVEIGLPRKIGRGLCIWHGGIVINGDVGDYCVFHGHNIVGNKGSGMGEQFPVIGSHVDFGAGAIAIGGIKLADNCVLGAGAVLVSSCNKTNTVLVGVPARELL